jgi:hypothetical protein
VFCSCDKPQTCSTNEAVSSSSSSSSSSSLLLLLLPLLLLPLLLLLLGLGQFWIALSKFLDYGVIILLYEDF